MGINMEGDDNSIKWKDREQLNNLPCVMDGSPKGNKQYVSSLCLKCLAINVSAVSTIHVDKCEGVVVLVTKHFTPVPHPPNSKYPPDNTLEEIAKECVQKEIKRLKEEPEYLEEMRAKFKGFEKGE